MFNFSFFSPKKAPTIRPVFLIIIDGWGVAPPSQGNVIARAKIPTFDNLFLHYPHTELIASGESVGLPANEVGSTEVGHLTIGTGRIIYQGLKRINVAIEDGTFFQNEAINKAITHIVKNNSKLHILGLLSTGKVHSSLDHLYALLEVCSHSSIGDRVFIHGFTDGRDSPPQEAMETFSQVEAKMRSLKVGQFASISGRYYAMDRDRRWERIEKAYQTIVEGEGPTAKFFNDVINEAYQKGFTDEFVPPTVLTKNDQPVATIDDNDAVIFFNFRIDRPKELTMALTLPDFENINLMKFGFQQGQSKDVNATEATFQRGKKPQNLFFVGMTNYQDNIPFSAIAFDKIPVENPLSQALTEAGVRHMHMAESEKERFVSYYFDGYREERFPNEDVEIIPSPRVPTYDRKPEMSTFELVKEFKKNLNKDIYHFFVMNIAAPDMVAHTGNIRATIKACEATDKAIGIMVDEILRRDGTVFISADHGHAEKLLAYPSDTFFFTTEAGNVSTDHSNNPVPLIIISNALKDQPKQIKMGALSDIAPTILSYMGIKIPPQMTGQDLLKQEPK